MKKINYTDANRDNTLYRTKLHGVIDPSPVTIDPNTGHIRIHVGLTPDSSMPVLKDIPAGVRVSTEPNYV